MDIGLIISAVYLVFIALAVLVGYSKGKKYVWQYTLTRLIINVLAVVIAVPVTKFVSMTAINKLLDKALASSGGDAQDLLSGFTVAAEIVKAFAAMFVGLFLFFFIRLIIKFFLKFFKYTIFSLICSISDAITDKRDYNRKKKDTLKAEATAISRDNQDSDTNDSLSEVSEEGSAYAETPDAVENTPAVLNESPAEKEKKPKKREGCYALKPQLASILIGIIGCMFGVAVVFAPFTGFIGLIDDTLDAFSEVAEDELESDADSYEIYANVKGVTGNIAVRMSNTLGGKLIFNGLTTYKVSGTKIRLRSEVNLLSTMGTSGMTLASENAAKQEKLDAIDEIIEAFDSSAVIPLLLSDIINSAAEAFESGEEFLGMNAEGGENDVTNKLLIELISSFKGCTPDSVKADVRTLGDIVTILINHDAVNTALDDAEAILSQKSLIKDLLTAFFENDHLSSLTSTLVEVGIGVLEDGLGMADTLEAPYAKLKEELAEIKSTYAITYADSAESAGEKRASAKEAVKSTLIKHGIDVTDDGAMTVANALVEGTDVSAALLSVEINKGNGTETVNLSSFDVFEEVSVLTTKKEIVITHKNNIVNPEAEAEYIADALLSIVELTDSMDSSDNGFAPVLKTVGTILDSLSHTELVGKSVVDKLVLVMFQSDKVSDILPMNTIEITSFVNSLIDSTDKGNTYYSVMSSITNMTDALSGMTDGETENANAALENALKDITPETAELLGHFATPEFVEDLGIEKESSEGVANVLTNLFDEISSAKDSTADGGLGLSDEEYRDEAEKISNLLDVTMKMSDGSGEEIAFDQYVGDVMDSKILSNTVINSVCDENGNVVNKDPLNTGKELTDGEKNDLVNKLNEKLNEKPGEETEKLVKAVAAYMNTDVVIEGGVVSVAP